MPADRFSNKDLYCRFFKIYLRICKLGGSVTYASPDGDEDVNWVA